MVYLGKNKKQRISKKQAKALRKEQKVQKQKFEEAKAKKVEYKAQGDFVLPKVITVRKLAEKINIPVTIVIKKLMENGIMASINESIDFDTAAIIIDEFGGNAKLLEEKKKKTEKKRTKLKSRAPIVVVLGHVDHGKTTLLDAIRKSDVVSTESGGITQHIGAYQVNWKDKKGKVTPITFLDTPGHEAFSTMRAHGTNITDVAILVVAADDGVKPQTKEAISHIKSANVPVVVAINKVDKPEADIDRVKRELAELGLNPEEWGGDTVMVPVSAKQNKGIDKLLDMVLVTAELQEIQAQYETPVEAVVIESHMQSGVGPVATILIKHGTLKQGDYLVIGDESYAKVRIMEDYLGKRIQKATPATPVRIAGINNVPNFGEEVKQVSNEREAKSIINKIAKEKKAFGAYEASQAIKAGDLKELPVILKADTQGSLEAIKNTILNIKNKKAHIKLISANVGYISENDITMAAGSNTLILGFKVNANPKVKELAKEKNVQLKIYDVIYRLFEDIEKILSGMVEPEYQTVIVGKMEVIKQFYKSADRKLVGGKIIDGKMSQNGKINIYHSGEKIGEGKIESLQIEKNKITEVKKGMECGISVKTKVNIKPKDIIEQYEKEPIK